MAAGDRISRLVSLGMNKHQARALTPGTSFTATNAADFPAGGTGVAAGGWSTAADRNTAIAEYNKLRADFNALVAELKNQGILS